MPNCYEKPKEINFSFHKNIAIFSLWEKVRKNPRFVFTPFRCQFPKFCTRDISRNQSELNSNLMTNKIDTFVRYFSWNIFSVVSSRPGAAVSARGKCRRVNHCWTRILPSLISIYRVIQWEGGTATWNWTLRMTLKCAVLGVVLHLPRIRMLEEDIRTFHQQRSKNLRRWATTRTLRFSNKWECHARN